MKKLMLFFVGIAMVGFLQAQTPTEKKVTTKTTETKEVKKVALKDHACTTECKAGKHVYKPGEKGYVAPKHEIKVK
jgi:hypothetical protein